jgi:hypothetical protein
MDLVSRDTESRLEEIEILLKLVKQIERSQRKINEVLPVAVSSVPVLKASAFLLLYNVIESCVRSAFQQTYQEMALDGVTFGQLPDGIKEVWIKQEFSVPTNTANQSTYLQRARNVADHVVENGVVDLDPRKLPISGSLDGDSIFKLCKKHGVALKLSRWAYGGAELVTVKHQRNALAHGHKSFSECGREYGVQDIERIYKQTKHFLSGFTKSVAKFNVEKSYRK